MPSRKRQEERRNKPASMEWMGIKRMLGATTIAAALVGYVAVVWMRQHEDSPPQPRAESVSKTDMLKPVVMMPSRNMPSEELGKMRTPSAEEFALEADQLNREAQMRVYFLDQAGKDEHQ